MTLIPSRTRRWITERAPFGAARRVLAASRVARASVLLGLAAAVASAAMQLEQAPEWQIARPLSEDEKADVVALAARLNVGQLAVIRSEVIHQPTGCEAIRLESARLVTGNRRTWWRAWISNSAWSHGCPGEQPDSPRVRSWVVAEPAKDIGAWHVPEGDGWIDVETPPSVPHGDVAAIVAAVRAGRLVNRLPPAHGNGRRLPQVNARSIYLIWNSQPDPALYKVWFRTTNVVLVVAVRGTVVELRDWMTEVS